MRASTGRRIASLVAIAALAAAPTGPAAGGDAAGSGGGWEDAIQIAPRLPGGEVSVDQSGGALVAWVTATEIAKVRRLTIAGDLGPARTIGDLDGANPNGLQLDALPAGGAIAGWAHGTEQVAIRTRRLGPRGRGGPTMTMATGDLGLPRIAADPNGRTVVAWPRVTDNGTMIEARVRRGDTIGPTHALSWPSPDVLLGGVAISNSSHAVVWWIAESADSWRAWGRRISPQGTLGPLTPLARSHAGVWPDALAVDGSGNARLVVSATGEGLGHRYWPVQGSPRRIRWIVRSINPVNGRIAMSPRGRSVVVWESAGTGGVDIGAATVNPNGTVTNERSLLPPREFEGYFAGVSIDAEGNALISWRDGAANGRIAYTRILRPGGAMSDVQRLGPTSLSLAVDVGARGHAVGVHDVRGDGLFARRQRVG